MNYDIIEQIFYDYIPLYMSSFKQIHRQLKWYKIHKELKDKDYLNLTYNIFIFDFEYIYIIRLPRLI
jgi:hypothetical protein